MSKISKMKLGDIGKISMCKRILKSQTSPIGEVPFYKISTFGGKADCFITRKLFEEYKNKYSFPKKGEILISAAGTLGKTVVYNGEEAFFQDSNIVWVDNDEKFVLNDFLYYYYQLKPWKKTTGSTIERLYNNNLRDINVVFPTEINEQKRIINVLKTIHNKIKNNNKINKELEQMVKTIYDYWFLQYEFPNEEGKPYKSLGGKMVWNEELGQEIPEGWYTVKVYEILSKVNNSNKLSSSEYKARGKYPIVDQSAKIICGYTDDDNGKIDFKNCIIFGDHTKIVKYIDFDFVRGADGTQVINSNNNSLPNYILYNQIKNMSLVSQGYSRYFKFLKDKYVLIPSKTIADKYMKIIEKSLNMIKKNTFENLKLNNIRDYLLPLLMNGQVGFKN